MQNKGFETSKKFNLDKEVDYAKEAIVSKTIINNETGTVTLFAFDKGQGLSEHTAPYNAMVQVIDGVAEIVINKENFIIAKGEGIIMPANVPHALDAKEKFKMILTMIKSL